MPGATHGIAASVEPVATAAPVRVGVLGLGYWGPNLVRNLNEIPAAEAAWMCDRRPEPLEALGRRFPSVRDGATNPARSYLRSVCGWSASNRDATLIT